MDIFQVLRGEVGSITQDQADALICAGLITEWPDKVLRLGPIAHNALFNLINDAREAEIKDCNYLGSALHEEAHDFAREIQMPDSEHALIAWWTNTLKLDSPSRVTRRPLPTIVDNRTPISIANATRNNRTALALDLLNRRLDHLVLLDDASPKDGPAVWTMTYILAHENGLTGLPLEGKDGLIARTADFLDKTYELSYLNALALDGPFLVSESIDAHKHINLDFSGVGGADPKMRGWNLSSTPGLIRGDECWFMYTGTFPDGQIPIDIPLSLSIHLSVLAMRRAATPGGEKVPGIGNAVVVIGERKGWLYSQGLHAKGATGNPTEAWLRIDDSGLLEYIQASNLHDIVPDLPPANSEPEAGLSAASSLLGFRVDEDGGIIDPRVLRTRIRLRGDQHIPIIKDLFNYINTCARSV